MIQACVRHAILRLHIPSASEILRATRFYRRRDYQRGFPHNAKAKTAVLPQAAAQWIQGMDLDTHRTMKQAEIHPTRARLTDA